MAKLRFGVGFRSPHFAEIEASPGRVDWLEILSEHHLDGGGPERRMLERLRADHPLLLHGVSLSIAGSEPLSPRYLRSLRELADRVEPELVSDHLAWTALAGHQSHDLLPVAFTESVLDHVTARVAHVQEALRRPILLENATVYVAFRASELSEAEFLRELCRRTGCGLLLDVNNLYVNSENLGIDPHAHLAELPAASVGYMHVAGHARLADVRIDTHDAAVPAAVWELFDSAVTRFPDAGVILERDDHLPSFAELCAELDLARARHAAARPLPPRDTSERARGRGESLDWPALQRDFWRRIVDKPVGFDHGAEPGASELVADDRPVPAARGLRVYSDAYGENLRRALATNFPTLARVLRADDFAALAAAYVRRHPPRGHDYRGLGARLPEFLASHSFEARYGVAPDALADLAALEQAQLEVQEERDEASVVTAEALAEIPAERWEGARFAFARAVRLVRARHDVLPAVDAVHAGGEPPLPERGAVDYLVQRVADRVRVERLTPLAAGACESLAAGGTFAEACSGADEAEAAEAAVELLVRLATRGLLAAISL